MEGVKYKDYELQLEPGSKLFVYTDGVPEATNAENQLFGTQRMIDTLNQDRSAVPEQVLKNVREAVDNYELELDALVENLTQVTAFVNNHLEAIDCPMKAQMQIELAVEEIFVNIANYAYAPEKGRATVRVEVMDDSVTVTITFIDRGVPYDPLAKEDPDVTLSAQERKIGGLGIFMTKKAMDDVSYEYKDGQNILTLIKNL